MFLRSLLPPPLGLTFTIMTEANKLLWNVGTYISIYTATYSRRFGYLSALLWETQMLHTCKYPYVHDYTFSETCNYQALNLYASSDITHHLFREAVHIPVIANLSGSWSITWMQLQTWIQINNLFLHVLAGHTVRFF